MPLVPSRLQELLAAFPKQRILVVGDLMLDEFQWGKVSRISPEAPVPVVDVQEITFYPGGAANVVRNLCQFCSKPGVVGVIGSDSAGSHLTRLLEEEGADTSGILKSEKRPTTHKLRIIARTQQVVRVDREVKSKLLEEEHAALLKKMEELVPAYDAVIIEDYGKGVLTQPLVDAVIGAANKAGKIVTVDPNPHNPLEWTGATAIKPNRSEALMAANVRAEEGWEAVEKAAQILRKRWKSQYLLITLGEEGMLLLDDGKPPYHTPTRAREVYDVSGAGDTSIAVFTIALAAGATGIEAAELANHAAGVVVGKLGTATLTLQELEKSFDRE